MVFVTEGLIIFLLVLVPALVGTLLVRRLFPSHFLHANREAADPAWAISGGLFGLLLGFMVVTLWQNLVDAQATVQQEASDLSSLYELTGGLPEADRAEARERIRTYILVSVEDEWPQLGRHRSSEAAEDAIDNLWQYYLERDREPVNQAESFEQSLSTLVALQEARKQRLDAADSTVPAPLWVVLLCGVGVMVVLLWFTGADNTGTQILMTIVLSLSLAAVLFLIRIFNNPFQGAVRVEPVPFERLLVEIDRR